MGHSDEIPWGTGTINQEAASIALTYSLEEGAGSSKRLKYNKVLLSPGKTGNFPGGYGGWEKLAGATSQFNQLSFKL